MTEAAVREKFIAIVGLPRSGTTLLTALLDRHPSFCLYYEPWNASPKNRPPIPNDLATFRACMEARFGAEATIGRSILGFKETTTNSATTGWAVGTVDALSQACDVRVVWIQRDPIHCLLSKIEGAKKWWGYPDAEFSKASLEQFLLETKESYEVLGGLLRRHRGLVVRYEELAKNPVDTLTDLMTALGETLEPAQLEYYKFESGRHARAKIMGDPALIENPAPVTRASIERREREVQEHLHLIKEVYAQPRFANLVAEFDRR